MSSASAASRAITTSSALTWSGSSAACSPTSPRSWATPQVRHRGTIGGSIAHGDPASDLPAAVVALGGSLVLRGKGSERVVPASEFFHGFLETALAPDELLVEVRVPKTPGARFSYQKLVKRAQDWAIVGAAVVRWDGGTGIGLANMGSTPIRATAVEQAFASGASAAAAATVADEGTSPTADLNASEDYRRHLARVLVRRGLEASASQPRRDSP
jgi:aerobic carbon-monoxide dehydrogenase medium subunit